jgi:hypothetical protein
MDNERETVFFCCRVIWVHHHPLANKYRRASTCNTVSVTVSAYEKGGGKDPDKTTLKKIWVSTNTV